jgi:hypothetical protein
METQTNGTEVADGTAVNVAALVAPVEVKTKKKAKKAAKVAAQVEPRKRYTKLVAENGAPIGRGGLPTDKMSPKDYAAMLWYHRAQLGWTQERGLPNSETGKVARYQAALQKNIRNASKMKDGEAKEARMAKNAKAVAFHTWFIKTAEAHPPEGVYDPEATKGPGQQNTIKARAAKARAEARDAKKAAETETAPKAAKAPKARSVLDPASLSKRDLAVFLSVRGVSAITAAELATQNGISVEETTEAIKVLTGSGFLTVKADAIKASKAASKVDVRAFQPATVETQPTA